MGIDMNMIPAHLKRKAAENALSSGDREIYAQLSGQAVTEGHIAIPRGNGEVVVGPAKKMVPYLQSVCGKLSGVIRPNTHKLTPEQRARKKANHDTNVKNRREKNRDNLSVPNYREPQYHQHNRPKSR